jgi:hypothetical protein
MDRSWRTLVTAKRLEGARRIRQTLYESSKRELARLFQGCKRTCEHVRADEDHRPTLPCVDESEIAGRRLT